MFKLTLLVAVDSPRSKSILLVQRSDQHWVCAEVNNIDEHFVVEIFRDVLLTELTVSTHEIGTKLSALGLDPIVVDRSNQMFSRTVNYLVSSGTMRRIELN